MKLFEALITFTPTTDEVGQGAITVSAETEEQAREVIHEFMEGVPDLEILQIREIIEISQEDFSPRTLN